MIGKKVNRFHLKSVCKDAICVKDNDSDINVRQTIKKFSNNSKFNIITTVRADDSMLYLFFETKPTKINKYEKNVETTPIINKLCSISQSDKFKPQTIFIQNK